MIGDSDGRRGKEQRVKGGQYRLVEGWCACNAVCCAQCQHCTHVHSLTHHQPTLHLLLHSSGPASSCPLPCSRTERT